MNHRLIVVSALLLTACASAPPPSPHPPASSALPHPQPAPPPPVTQSPNRLTPLASISRTIVEPRIRVGLASDQATATFERIPDGYDLVADAGPFVIRRGFTIPPPPNNTSLPYPDLDRP